MKKEKNLLAVLALALVLPATIMMVISLAGAGCNEVTPSRPEGPCDIYAADGSPCVAAHSSTRALYASYNGPLYQVIRQSDGKTMDIGVVEPARDDPGGYADAASQDKFCANTYCWISILYDQSGTGNHLYQSPRGGTGNPPQMGGFNSLPVADMAPVTLMGHKVYGIFIEPGMGLRQDDPKGTAVDDQAEGQYWVINGHHYNGGCCFDYGNAEIDSRDDGDGTMETTYFGNAVTWYYGQGSGPWLMTDQENNVVGCVTDSPTNKFCPDLPSIPWRFVTETFDGEPSHWRTMGGDAQRGDLSIMFDGTRVQNEKATRPELKSSYDPMRKQGAIDLGNGGDNGNWSQGTMYEGAMTAAGTFPTEETNRKIQANIVAAGYDVPSLSVAPANATDMPPGLQTFSPGSSQNTTVTFTNTTGAPVTGLNMSLTLPGGWKAVVQNSTETSKSFPDQIEPGASVNATFTVTSGSKAFNGDLVAEASWKNTDNSKTQSEIAVEKVRNVDPAKINEFRITDGTNTTNSFIELYNAGNSEIDISNWTLTIRPYQMPIFSSINIPEGTKLASNGFYLLGMSNSGLAVPAKKGESIIYVRSTTGMSAGDVIEIGEGANMERRTIKSVGTAAGLQGASSGIRSAGPDTPSSIWQPLPEGPVITIPKGSTNVPVASVVGMVAGQKIAIGYGATYPVAVNPVEKYEVVTVKEVGKPGTQGWLSMDAKAGDTNIKVYPIGDISVGDKIRLDVASEGHGIEWVTVTKVGTQSVRNTFNGPLADNEDPGTGLDLAEPLKFNHSSNLPFACNGTGITVEPATAFDHSSNEPVLPLGTGITLDQPLTMDHEINSIIRDEKVTTMGYQGTPAPEQWFGGPAFSISAGNMVLRDAAGNVVDGLNYGLIVDPWAAEGYMGVSEIEASGCRAPSPRVTTTGVNIRPDAMSPFQPDMSTGRYPDGTDNDSNCSDFNVQNNTFTLASSAAGSDNIKVANVAGFREGQKIIIDKGTNSETAIVKTVGTAGATTTGAATSAGTNVITVARLTGFSVGQTITIGSGSNAETATIATLLPARGRIGSANYVPTNSLRFTTSLRKAHPMGSEVSGSGITLTATLTKAHETGAQAAINLPTPGQPNQY
ncbi:MAG TPA: arabinofuranosidase catalytic domain-containing protein [Bacteroidales bacterium]|nr:arabinofuranosidase catalytic domain-containing protein [Bacteroidales bacterium]